MAVAKFDVIEQYLDNSGDLLAGGLVYTYAATTETPLATYNSSAGNVANANPVVLDSAGRASIWFTKGVAYKVIIKTAAGVTLKTEDGLLIIDETTLQETIDYLVSFDYTGAEGPDANYRFGGGHVLGEDVTFPANFTGSYGRCDTGSEPGATYVITLKKNLTTIGTVSVADTGVFTFASQSGAAVVGTKGQQITAHGASSGDADFNNFAITLVGAIQ